MMNSTFDEVHEAQRDAAVVLKAPDNRPGLSFLGFDFDNVTGIYILPELSTGLMDPVFQDLGYSSRFLVDYCKHILQLMGSTTPGCSYRVPHRPAARLPGHIPRQRV